MKDQLGDRMKEYEAQYTGLKVDPTQFVIARLDGCAFHTFTKAFSRPYDATLADAMCSATNKLMRVSGAAVGYTQSDEITLIWTPVTEDARLWFDGKVLKMCSVLSAIAASEFNADLNMDKLASFDCRVFNVPSAEEAANNLLWRFADCTRNAVNMLAHHFFPESQLHGRSTSERRDMLFNLHNERKEEGDLTASFDRYPDHFRLGSMYARRIVMQKYTEFELSTLNPKHQARLNPDLEYERRQIYRVKTDANFNVGQALQLFGEAHGV